MHTENKQLTLSANIVGEEDLKRMVQYVEEHEVRFHLVYF